MNILVTGGAGYIGSHTSHQLIQAGHKVVVLDNLSTGQLWAVPQKAIFVEGNIGDRTLVSRILREHQIQAVVHFAGSIVVSESVEVPLKYYENNTLNSLYLINTCVEEGVLQFVFSSTAAVYGDPQVLPVSEESPTQPLSPYGTSKLMTEWVLRDLSASFGTQLSTVKRFRYIVLRYFNVAGAQVEGNLGQTTHNATHLIKIACEAVCGLRKKVGIYGTDYPTPDGTCIRDYIHVEDLARAHLDALRYLDGGGESQILNCGYGHGFSVREVLRTIQDVSGVKFPVVEEPRRAGDSAAVVANVAKIQRMLGWKPQYDDLHLICETAIRWEKKQRRSEMSAFALSE